MRELRLGDLIVLFSDHNWYDNLTIRNDAPQNGVEAKENPLDSGITEEDRKAALLITDPVAYEEELLNN